MATTAAALKKDTTKSKDVYTYTGTDKRGRKVNGEMSGANVALVRAQLRRQASCPTRSVRNLNPCSANAKPPLNPGISRRSRGNWPP